MNIHPMSPLNLTSEMQTTIKHSYDYERIGLAVFWPPSKQDGQSQGVSPNKELQIYVCGVMVSSENTHTWTCLHKKKTLGATVQLYCCGESMVCSVPHSVLLEPSGLWGFSNKSCEHFQITQKHINAPSAQRSTHTSSFLQWQSLKSFKFLYLANAYK